MKTKNLFILAAMAVFAGFTACTNDEEQNAMNNEGDVIRLSASINDAEVTRAGTAIQSTAFDYDAQSPEQINVEIIDHNGPQVTNLSPSRVSYLFETTATAGALTPSSTIPYFPKTGNSVDIYAYYPSSFGTTASSSNYTWTEGATTFTVANDQSGEAGYKASDLMYGVPASNPVARTSGTTALTFTHKMSKVIVQLQPDGAGIQAADLVGAIVSMKAMNSISVDNTGASTAVSWNSGTAATINMGTVDATDKNVAAIVVPQTIAHNSANVFTITLASGAVYTYTYEGTGETPAALSLAAGNVNTITLELSVHAVRLADVVITDWGSGSTDSKTLRI